MGWIADNFGTYDAYMAYTEYQHYDYHIKLIYNSTSQVLKINPAGTTESGIEYSKDSRYLGVLTKITLKLGFAYVEYGGGDILRDDLYNVTGPNKSECEVEWVKLNPDTKDFDVYFTGNVDFTSGSYSEEVDEAGLRVIRCDIIESGDIQKLLSRDGLSLNLESNTSVGGVTVTDVSRSTIGFPAVNYYLEGASQSGALGATVSYSSSGTYYYYYSAGTTRVDQTAGRFNFETLTGQIYTNTSDESKDIKAVFDYDYFVSTNCGTGSTLTMRYQLISYTSAGTPITTKTLLTLTNTAEGVKTESGNVSVEYDYSEFAIPVDGYIVFQLRVDAVKGSGLCDLNLITFQDNRNFNFYERSPSPGSSEVDMISVYNAMLKSMRLMMDRDDCFESDFLTDAGNPVSSEYLTSVRNLSGTLNPWVPVSFSDLFDHVRSIWQIALTYNRSTGRFKIVEDTEIYPDVNLGDLGTVSNFEFSVMQYPAKLLTGYDQDGNIDGLQGVDMTHLSSTHALDVPDKGTLNLRGKFIMSAYQIEANRRKQVSDTGQQDTKNDDQIIYVYTSSGSVVTVGSKVPPYLQGFEGIDEIYNPITTPSRNLRRNNMLRGFFNFDASGIIKFVSNKKNVDYLHLTGTPYYEQDDINVSELNQALYLPEQITCESVFSATIKEQLDTDPYGWWDMTDEAGETYKVHIENASVQDKAKKVKLTLKIHNG